MDIWFYPLLMLGQRLSWPLKKFLDAVVLNCHQEPDIWTFVIALRSLQPNVAVVMFSGYCGIPCRQLEVADVFSEGREHRSVFDHTEIGTVPT
jgi:hypothetical protein